MDKIYSTVSYIYGNPFFTSKPCRWMGLAQNIKSCLSPMDHPELDDYGHFSDNQSFQIESIKVMQGSIPRSANQFIKNQTTQSYMSCLEDGTKKIKFT